MIIKQDPITKLWCREDGAILMPPTKHSRFKTFRWTFGTEQLTGYRTVWYRGKTYFVHQMVCRAFNGLPPEGKPEVDHKNRIKVDNFFGNLRWTDRKGNDDNRDCVDKSIEKYGVRCCDDPRAYGKAYRKVNRTAKQGHEAAHYARMKAQGLTKRKGPDGKWGWYPRVAPVKEVATCL